MANGSIVDKMYPTDTVRLLFPVPTLTSVTERRPTGIAHCSAAIGREKIFSVRCSAYSEIIYIK